MNLPFTFIITTTFFFFFFTSTAHRVTLTSTDIINQTCETCAAKSAVFSYDFCISSLLSSSSSSPTSQTAKLSGLAIASMLQALDNATATVSTIKKLLGGGGFDPFALACLQDCLQLYEDGIGHLVDAVRAFLRRQYGTADSMVSAAMEAAVTCEEGFGERGGDGVVSPLRRENYSLFQLGDIALCIINTLSSGYSVMPS